MVRGFSLCFIYAISTYFFLTGKTHVADDLDIIMRVYDAVGKAHPNYTDIMRYQVTVNAFSNKLMSKFPTNSF